MKFSLIEQKESPMKTIILAGGSGTRLWPMSRKNYPKQFLSLGEELSLLQKTIERQLSFCKPKDIFFITNEAYKDIIAEQMVTIAEIPYENIITEPVARNTAPAIALATQYLLEKGSCDKDEAVVVVAADHIITPIEKYGEYVIQAGKLAEQGHIVTFGIHPSAPETGYGYILRGPEFEMAYQVEAFVEKPDLDTAKHYLECGDYYWNSGMFAFTPRTIMEELKQYSPEIHTFCQNDYSTIFANFADMPKISIDYAVMEKSSRVIVLPFKIKWSDIGSYDSYYDLSEKDENNNVIHGDVISIDSHNNLIISNKRLISVIDIENLNIIETKDSILITRKGSSQRVKEVVDHLQTNKRQEVDEHKCGCN